MTDRKRIARPAVLVGSAAVLGVAWWLLHASPRGDDEAAQRPGAPQSRPIAAPVAPSDAPERGAPDVDPIPSRVAATPDIENASTDTGDAPRRGVVVDIATGEPIPYCHVVAGEQSADVDHDGRFTFPAPLSSGVGNLSFHDRFQGTHIRDVGVDRLEPDGDRWIARIAIGPTFRVRILGADGEDPSKWRARLVELLAEGGESAGSWIRVRDVDPPFLRYDNPWEPNTDGSRFRVDVMHAEGTRRGRSATLRSAIGVYPEIVDVVADQVLCSITGRVIDTDGNPRDHADVTAVPLLGAGDARGAGDEAWRHARSGDDGRFTIGGIVPGVYRVTVRPRRGETPVTRNVSVTGGRQDIGDFRVPSQVGAGMIEGRLVSRRGERFDGQLIVRLRAVDGRPFELLDVTSPPRILFGSFEFQPSDRDANAGHVFEFNEVPRGDYKLSVISRDGYRWTPATARVRPPDDKVVFTREDEIPHRDVVLRAMDPDGKPIASFRVQLQRGEVWHPQTFLPGGGGVNFSLPRDLPFSWTITSDGRRPVRGDETDGAVDDDTGALVITATLRPGFGARIVCRDLGDGFLLDDKGGWMAAASRPAVAGVRIFADGRHVGTSDAHGVVDVQLDREPERIELVKSGWRLAPSQGFSSGRLTGGAADVVLWMARE